MLHPYSFSLTCHVIEIDVVGPSNNNGDCFTVRTVRTNPCQSGAVTGNETYASFLQSIKGENLNSFIKSFKILLKT